jgi:hypothetical protein
MGTKAEFIAAIDNTGMAVSGDTFTVNTGTNKLTIAAHGRTTGDGPLMVSSTGAAPAPLTVLTELFAAGVLTLTGNAVEDEIVTIGNKTYTFKDTVGATANEIFIGTLATDTIDNLVAAINGDAGAGSLYGSATVAHTQVEAAAGAGDTMDVTALVAGVAANAYATTTDTTGSFGAATLTGGRDAQENAFYVIVTSASEMQLANSYDNAVAETPVPLDITTAGTGTHTLSSSVALFADRVEAEMLEMQANGNRAGIKDVIESRFWDGLIASL